MSLENVLSQVEEDLARGHTFLAQQRLHTLVRDHPLDLDLRGRLGAVHLRTGNLVEAGRWSYLDRDPDPAAVAAFEKAYAHPRARWEALHWPEGPEAAEAEHARKRLDVLALEARSATPRRSGPDRRREDRRREDTAPPPPDRWFTSGRVWVPAAWLVLGVVVLAVWFVGVVTVVRWVF
jgi:hypothetical protein